MFFIYIRYIIPHFLIEKDEKLRKDLVRWKEIHQLECSDEKAMAILLWRYKEFRNLVIYRNRKKKIRRRIFSIFYPPMESLYIDAFEIGGGLYIQHGFSTMIAAKKIGENEYKLSGRLEIERINELFDLELPESDDYQTIGGMILSYHQSFPKVNETITIDKFQFKIQKTRSTRIEEVTLKII